MASSDVQSILKLSVPVIVRLAHRKMKLRDVMNLAPGSLVELPRNASEPLDLMVNNKLIGAGAAVKVGENFGLQVAAIGPAIDRIRALGPATATAIAPAPKPDAQAAEAPGSTETSPETPADPTAAAPAETPAPTT